MKIKEIKELSTKDLIERIEADKVALNQLEIQHSISPLDNPMQIKFARKGIAQMKTILCQRELNQN